MAIALYLTCFYKCKICIKSGCCAVLVGAISYSFEGIFLGLPVMHGHLPAVLCEVQSDLTAQAFTRTGYEHGTSALACFDG